MKKLEKDELEAFVAKLNKQNVIDDRNNKYRLAKYDAAVFTDEDRPFIKFYPDYLKGVKDAMLALGYDEGWINDTFKKALEKNLL